MSTFEKWNLEAPILEAIKSRGWVEPTEIQVDAIPLARTGKDIVGQAKTGSGKTAAFGIPILEICQKKGTPQAIILCPTRELAVQVTEEMIELHGTKGLNIISAGEKITRWLRYSGWNSRQSYRHEQKRAPQLRRNFYILS